MQVTETLSEGLRRAYTVVVPATDLEGKRNAKLADLGKTLRLPGFRPGKVPASLVRRRYGAAVMAEVMQDALGEATEQLIRERNLRPAGQPRVDLQGAPAAGGETAADLSFKVELDLLPEITVPDLGALSLTRLRAEPQPEAIERALASLAARQRELEPLPADHAAGPGDVVVADFVGSVEGKRFPGGEGKGVEIEIGGSGFIPGFAEQLEGIRAGETRTISVTFPAEYGAKELAGKQAEFEVTAQSVNRPAAAALDDALADKLGFEGGIEKLRAFLTQQMQRELDQVSRLRIKRELLDQLAERADFPAPQNLVEAEFAAIWQRVEADRKSGQADAEDAGKDEETLKAEYRAIAERRVRLGLLLSEIGRANNIQVTPEEMASALRREAMRYPGQEMQVVDYFRKNPQAADALRGPIFEDKVVDFILELAKVEERQVSPEELNDMDSAEGGVAVATQGSEGAGATGAGAAEAAA
jgi:trigger factor